MKRVLGVIIALSVIASGANAGVSLSVNAPGNVIGGVPNPFSGGGSWLGSSPGLDLSGETYYTPLISPDTSQWSHGKYSDWRVEIMIDSGTANDYNAMLTEYKAGLYNNQGDTFAFEMAGPQASDQFMGNVGGGDMGFSYNPTLSNSYANQKYYIRYFNADTEGNATEAGFIYNTNWVLPAVDAPVVSGQSLIDIFAVDADTMGTLQDGTLGNFDDLGDGVWSTVAVPEPGTMALFGIGMAVVAFRRRRKV